MTKRRFRSLLPCLGAALLLAMAGCGDDEDGGEAAVDQRVKVEVPEADSDGKDPTGAEVLDELQTLTRGQSDDAIPAIRGSEGLTVPEWLHTVNADVAAYWAELFALDDYAYEPAVELIFNKPTTTACGGGVDPREGPFYCSGDQTIFLPIAWFTKNVARHGDAAVAVIVAHENGHHVQDLLGIFDQPYLTIQTELQADCLAGVWANSILGRDLLEPGDIAEILGEVRISGDPKGLAVDDPRAHGSAGLRRDAFLRGYQGGDPGSCPVPPV